MNNDQAESMAEAQWEIAKALQRIANVLEKVHGPGKEPKKHEYL